MRTTSVDYASWCSSLSSTNRTSGEEAPTECTEYTEPLAEKGLPQMARMRTDVGGYGIPAIHTLPNSVFCWRTTHSKHLCKSVKSVGGKRFPQNARKLLAEKNLPQMTRMRTDVGGYGIPAIPTLPNSVNSVNSVGEQRTLSICVNL